MYLSELGHGQTDIRADKNEVILHTEKPPCPLKNQNCLKEEKRLFRQYIFETKSRDLVSNF